MTQVSTGVHSKPLPSHLARVSPTSTPPFSGAWWEARPSPVVPGRSSVPPGGTACPNHRGGPRASGAEDFQQRGLFEELVLKWRKRGNDEVVVFWVLVVFWLFFNKAGSNRSRLFFPGWCSFWQAGGLGNGAFCQGGSAVVVGRVGELVRK